MKLNLKNPLQAKACSLVATTIALAAMAASNAAADNVSVFDEIVSGVPAANPVGNHRQCLFAGVCPGAYAEGFDRLRTLGGDHAIRTT